MMRPILNVLSCAAAGKLVRATTAAAATVSDIRVRFFMHELQLKMKKRVVQRV
jgi:hypothetical protein